MKRFRLYPEADSPVYFEVRIYDSRRQWLQALRRSDKFLGLQENWKEASAVCRSFETLRRVGKLWKSVPRLGIIFLYQPKVSMEIVAHELTHAVVQWARRIGLRGSAIWGRGIPHSSREVAANERFAYAVGHLNRGFWASYFGDKHEGTMRI